MLMFCLYASFASFSVYLDSLLHLVVGPLPLLTLGEQRHFPCWPAASDSLLFILSDAASLAFFSGQSSSSKGNNECVFLLFFFPSSLECY